jgi:hypothetical protein
MRRALHQVVREIVVAAGIDPEDAPRVDLGDGVMVLFDPTLATTRVAGAVLDHLGASLADRNRRAPGERLRLRLRAALHRGEVLIDAHGYVGAALIEASRLSNATAVRERLGATTRRPGADRLGPAVDRAARVGVLTARPGRLRPRRGAHARRHHPRLGPRPRAVRAGRARGVRSPALPGDRAGLPQHPGRGHPGVRLAASHRPGQGAPAPGAVPAAPPCPGRGGHQGAAPRPASRPRRRVPAAVPSGRRGSQDAAPGWPDRRADRVWHGYPGIDPATYQHLFRVRVADHLHQGWVTTPRLPVGGG